MEATITSTQKEIAALTGVTVQAIQLRAQKENWPFIEIAGRGRGGKIKRYPLHSLPTEIILLYKRNGANGGNGAGPQAKREESTSGEINGIDSSIPLSLDGRVSPPLGGPVTGGASLPPTNSPSPLPSPVKVEGAKVILSLQGRGGDEEDVDCHGSQGSPRNDLVGEKARIVCEGLTDWQTRIAAARFDLVSAYIRDKARARRKNGCSVVRACREFVEAYNADVILKDLHASLGDTSWKTLEKWHVALERNGYDMACLAPLYGQHRKGQSKTTAAEMEAMLRFALHPNRLRISQIVRFAKKTLLSEGIDSPASEATMRRAIITWRDRNYDRWVFFREGEKALADKVLPYIERDADRLEVGDVLVADGHKLNFQILNPYTGKPGRATLLMFYDWASRYPAGWHIMFSENIQCVHAALRRAILALGKLPLAVLLDNGKAFKARVFHGKVDLEQAGIQGLYARLGIQAHFAFPYNAKAKPVERFFGTFNELERLLPSYTGNSIEDKPAHLLRNEKLQRRMHSGWVPTLTEADAIIEKWCRGEYATRPHRGISGRTPESAWNAGRGPGIEEEGLRFLMMTHEIKKVGRNGVNLFGQNFYDEALYGYREQVLVRLDYHNMDRVFVYTADDSQFLCEARLVRGTHPIAKLSGNPLDLEAVQEGNKRQKRLKKATEKEARRMAEEIAPWSVAPGREEVPTPYTPAQIAEIEAKSAATEVIHLEVEEKKPIIITTDAERFWSVTDRMQAGEEVGEPDREFVREYAQGEAGRGLLDTWSDLRELLESQGVIATAQRGDHHEIRGV